MVWGRRLSFVLGESEMELVRVSERESLRFSGEGDSPPPATARAKPPRETLYTFFVLVHLAFWAQLGVLARFWIDEAVTSTCYGDVVLEVSERPIDRPPPPPAPPNPRPRSD